MDNGARSPSIQGKILGNDSWACRGSRHLCALVFHIVGNEPNIASRADSTILSTVSCRNCSGASFFDAITKVRRSGKILGCRVRRTVSFPGSHNLKPDSARSRGNLAARRSCAETDEPTRR
jgi:hypothetical protein